MTSVLSVVFLTAGAFFFVAGTIGLLRFPDVYCRLHALTKADNLGVGMLVVGLMLQPAPWAARLQLVLTWFLVVVAAATVCHLLARSALRQGIEPVLGDWRSRD
ncbi:MAG: monovalent cation/H(+) antiporter subunit G [Gemmatimonadota bacterium]